MTSPNDFGYFQIGAKVTICTDAEGKHPRRIGEVKRHGIGAWRLKRSSEWFNADGRRMAVGAMRFVAYDSTTCFARPYKDGDEEAILAEDKRVEKRNLLLSNINGIERRIYLETVGNRNLLRDALEDISYCKGQITKGEEVVAMAEATLLHYKSNLDDAGKRAEKTREQVNVNETKIREHHETIVRLQAELKAFDEKE